MSLYELQKEYNYKKTLIKYAKNKLKYLRNSLEPGASKMQEEVVSGSRRKKDISDTMAEIIYLEEEIKMYEEELNLLTPILQELEDQFKEYNDIYKRIYYDYYIKGYTADKIGLKYCYSRAQVYNIINKVDEELKCKKIRQN
jgi:uncharacterized FlgJ-related protein